MDTSSQVPAKDSCESPNIAALLSQAVAHLRVAYDQLQRETADYEPIELTTDGGGRSQDFKTIPGYLMACVSQLQKELPGIIPNQTMTGLGSAWLQITDYQNDLAQALDTLVQTIPEATAITELQSAN